VWFALDHAGRMPSFVSCFLRPDFTRPLGISRQRGRDMTVTGASLGPPILVVDDNRDAADSLALLVQLWGFRPVVAYDGRAAAEAVAADGRPPVAALIDLGLPGLDGYEVARRLRADPRCAGAVLIAVTGYGRPEDRQRSREAGFDHHVLKPCDPQELRQLLPAPA
jgi:CheY-like chemotaxis protein